MGEKGGRIVRRDGCRKRKYNEERNIGETLESERIFGESS